MAFCRECGAELRENAKFCEHCGTAVIIPAAVQPEAEEAPETNVVPETNETPEAPAEDAYPFGYEENQGTSFVPVPPVPPYQADYQNDGQNNGGNGYYSAQDAAQRPKAKLSFSEAMTEFFKRYADFNGRTVKSGYWYVFLFHFVLSSAITLFSKQSDGHFATMLAGLFGLYSLAVLIPSIAICVRRLHDAGKSAVYLLWLLLPVAGYIILIVALCGDSQPDNQWGPSPAE